MKTITVSYFAVLRECSGKSSETIQSGADSYRDVYEELRMLYKFPLDASRVRVAIGESYGDMDEEVVDGANITFIPPVAGG